ncbi:hypothetical protein H696_00792 [Fonticula alba]|uniref:Anaphase-promoting complex subunit 4 WD40 domain-containing protein n=1 Tax=Fonticula alba TaxID=691883 RepID=A0A058ZH09_FONAL|nr:hypothetical protein H696_00792 [Fonticula alba]KCV73251.1 hypothetical protein H696_00792 [Fonticula alba]|eukprot:XP_009492952.1 hypothetical protein H696_00792 [Fonticula alba]
MDRLRGVSGRGGDTVSLPVQILAFSPDGHLLATADARSNLVRIWHSAAGGPLLDSHDGPEPHLRMDCVLLRHPQAIRSLSWRGGCPPGINTLLTDCMDNVWRLWAEAPSPSAPGQYSISLAPRLYLAASEARAGSRSVFALPSPFGAMDASAAPAGGGAVATPETKLVTFGQEAAPATTSSPYGSAFTVVRLFGLSLAIYAAATRVYVVDVSCGRVLTSFGHPRSGSRLSILALSVSTVNGSIAVSFGTEVLIFDPFPPSAHCSSWVRTRAPCSPPPFSR